MDDEYLVFKKDGTLLTKTDVRTFQEKFSLKEIPGEDGEIILPCNIDESIGDVIYSGGETIIEFYGDVDNRIKKKFETKYNLSLR